jgi:hypothetical protein
MAVLEPQLQSLETSLPNISKAEKHQNEEPEIDGGYGWVVMIAMLLITAHTWGINGVRLPYPSPTIT